MKYHVNRKTKYLLLQCAVLTWLAGSVCAADSPVGGDTHVTTGDIVVAADAAKEAAKYESQSTTIITKEDIERKQGKSAEDVVFNEVGITRTVAPMGRVGISVRGADPRHTLIMVDGQPVLGDVSKYAGSGDELMRIGAENIERIEIIRGAASAKYGSDAIGGVVNIITQAPKNKAEIKFNAEGRYHSSRYFSSNETSALPTNFYLRADSGKLGKFKIAGWASKRDIMPVYAKDQYHSMTYDNVGTILYKNWEKGKNWTDDFKPSLRYYGKETNTGVFGTYEFNKNQKIDFRISHDDEIVERRNKTAWEPLLGGSFEEPMRVYHRTMKRDNYSFSYSGKSSRTDWTFNINHGKTKENDVLILSHFGSGHTAYSGFNTLGDVDWLKHNRTDVNVNFNTYIGNIHALTYGIGHTKERASGSQLKSAPKTYIQTIDPWDYDKSLYVKDNTAGIDDKPSSKVHNFKLIKNEHGFSWDKNSEYYGNEVPPLSYEEAEELWNNYSGALMSDGGEGNAISDSTLREHYQAFKKKLDIENNYAAVGLDGMAGWIAPITYYGFLNDWGFSNDKLKYNGQSYKQGFLERENQILIGEAELEKTYAYVQDNWQISKNTTVTPSLRIDHSNLFGSQLTGNMGILHNIHGNTHRRLKANIGTGYAEPGMGELYYNWEMYGGTSDNHWGWYWIGNPDLKPEKSVNFDISLEGENNKTFAKVSLFHNEIKNYLTSYFTGQLIDFDFHGSGRQTPDRIYSFRNLGKAKITGIEAELRHKFNKHWSAKLGYTLLHAVNASDPDMPHRLLDKPKQKIDIGLNYENESSHIRGAFWGGYYMHMLDSNSVSIDDTWGADQHGVYTRKKAQYNEKSFGIWNMVLEKDFGNDLTAYIGVDNIFNHRDDDRAIQDRVYRFGVNVKVSDLGDTFLRPFRVRTDANGNPIMENPYGNDWFLRRIEGRNGERKAGDIQFFGEYRLRSNMYTGENKAVMRETKETHAEQAAVENHTDASGHGLDQRLRLGADYQIDKKLNLQIVGSTSKRDMSYRTAEKRGLHNPYLEKAELTKSTPKWDWTIGRIHEPMGVTGYWFGREYDGIRGVYTNKATQISIGYGDFGAMTGITDSAYSHKEKSTFRRAPTMQELLGYYLPSNIPQGTTSGIYPEAFDPAVQANYREKFNHAGQIWDAAAGEWKNDPSLNELQIAQRKLAVVRELVGIFRDIDAAMKKEYAGIYVSDGHTTYDDLKKNYETGDYTHVPKLSQLNITLKLENGASVDLTKNNYAAKQGLEYLAYGKPFLNAYGEYEYNRILNNTAYGGLEGLLQEKNIRTMMGEILDAVTKKENSSITSYEFKDKKGNTIVTGNRNEAIDHMFVDFVGEREFTLKNNSRLGFIGNLLESFSHGTDFAPMGFAPVPLPGAPLSIVQEGYVLRRDIIPALDRAAYVKIKRQLTRNTGVELWKLNSFGEGAYDSYGLHEMKIADIIGVGAQVRVGNIAMLSFDYGQNRAAMGKFFHGGRDSLGNYNHSGSVPKFWVVRMDIGKADTEMPGSWHAYFDYKSFEHGSFVGGTGADIPDRYIDGIRSFTVGLGYVPAKDFLIEAGYTFGAKGLQKRDTLYTPESFKLGDYTRIQATYKF